MKNVMAAILLAFIFSSSVASAAEEKKPPCTVSEPAAGTTVIACPGYIVTKDTTGTTICQITHGEPGITCSKVEVK